MPDSRKIIFANNEVYHVFNRGIDRRPIFLNKREYNHSLETMRFYQFNNLPMRMSKFVLHPFEERLKMMNDFYSNSDRRVNILAFCLMPNHFHILLQQNIENGITKFVSDYTNSYTKYFNAKYKRYGPLFQGLFKAVHIETDEQLIHLSRYIHLNPVTSYIVEPGRFEDYPYSSYKEYISDVPYSISVNKIVMDLFPSSQEYKSFVSNQINYQQELKKINHLIIEK